MTVSSEALREGGSLGDIVRLRSHRASNFFGQSFNPTFANATVGYPQEKMLFYFLMPAKPDEARMSEDWGEWWGSNPRQPEPQSGALPTELHPPCQTLDLSIRIYR